MSNPIILIAYNTAHYALLMRSKLIHRLQEEGFSVSVIAPTDKYSSKLEEMGVLFIDLPMRMNKNPFTDLVLMFRFRNELKKLMPSVFLGFTAKPNIFGGLAAISLGIPTVNNISGLGAVFDSQGFSSRVMQVLYKFALFKSSMVFFQNPDDAMLFVNQGVVKHMRYDTLPGSGVDLTYFGWTPMPACDGRKFRFLLIARMLRDKGVEEYVAAARNIKKNRDDVEFELLGSVGVNNPTAITAGRMAEWVSEGIVQHSDFCEDVREKISAADCVVLPSYREGTPRSLLEAASMGRPIITTNAIGSREVVLDGVNGLLCKSRDSLDLEVKMRQMLNLPRDKLSVMGVKGRELMEERFNENFVLDRYLQVIRHLCQKEQR